MERRGNRKGRGGKEGEEDTVCDGENGSDWGRMREVERKSGHVRKAEREKGQ